MRVTSVFDNLNKAIGEGNPSNSTMLVVLFLCSNILGGILYAGVIGLEYGQPSIIRGLE